MATSTFRVQWSKDAGFQRETSSLLASDGCVNPQGIRVPCALLHNLCIQQPHSQLRTEQVYRPLNSRAKMYAGQFSVAPGESLCIYANGTDRCLLLSTMKGVSIIEGTIHPTARSYITEVMQSDLQLPSQLQSITALWPLAN